MGVVMQIFRELLSEKQLQLENAKRSGKTNCFTGIHIQFCIYTHKKQFFGKFELFAQICWYSTTFRRIKFCHLHTLKPQ